MPTRIDEYSLATVPITMRFNATRLGEATAFVWQRHEKLYLITNWHVVTGRNNETSEAMAPHAAEPNKLVAQFRSSPNFIDTIAVDIPLRDADGAPLWLFHPVHRRKVDVVAIPLSTQRAEWAVRPINSLSHNDELSVQIGMDVYVLGYPFGAALPALPVWKRGSIATEPQLATLGEKYLLIDSASRPGMSGAPVILRSYGAHLTESGTSITTDPATRFIGVYSGRLHTRDAEDAQLGRVWPRSFIIEIVDASARDDGDFARVE